MQAIQISSSKPDAEEKKARGNLTPDDSDYYPPKPVDFRGKHCTDDDIKAVDNMSKVEINDVIDTLQNTLEYLPLEAFRCMASRNYRDIYIIRQR